MEADRLQKVLDGRWAEARVETRGHLRDPELHPVDGLSIERARERTWHQLSLLAKTRGPLLGFPERYGGEGDVGGSVTAFETLGHGDLSLLVKSGVQWGLFGGAILHLGTELHHEKYLRRAMSLDLPGCFAMTETGHGSDVQSLRTTAIFDAERDAFVINTPDSDARKDYIGNAARDGRMAVVFAQLVTPGGEHGVHAFMVPIRDENGEVCPGITIEDCGHKAGLNGVDNGRIWFDHVRVPRESLLDRYATVSAEGAYESPIENDTRRFFTMVGTLVQGRASVSGAAVSAAKSAVTIAVRYGLVRRQFRPPGAERELVLLDYRQHQRRLMPLLATTYALHFAQANLVGRLHEAFSGAGYPEREQRMLESLAAGVKATSTWHATRTIQTCREACGGAGYLSVNRLAAMKADTDVFTTFEGDNTVLLQLVAKGLLTDYRDEFVNLDTVEMLRYAADLVIDQVLERIAPARQLVRSLVDSVPRNESETELRDRGYQLELFEWRERHVLEGVARRMKRGVDKGSDAFSVFNDAQDHVLLAAQAHIDRVILETFVEGIDECEDPEISQHLDKVCDLHALSVLERERAWYMEHGRLSAGRAKAIISEVNALCGELREDAGLLTDAFAIPDEILGAPIALGEESERQEGKDRTDSESGIPGFAPPPP